MGVEAHRDECRGFIFRDHGRSRDGRSGCHLVAAVQGNLDNLPCASVEKLAAACSFPGRLARDLGDARWISRLGGREHRPAQHLDRSAWNRSLEQGRIVRLERLTQTWEI